MVKMVGADTKVLKQNMVTRLWFSGFDSFFVCPLK